MQYKQDLKAYQDKLNAETGPMTTEDLKLAKQICSSNGIGQRLERLLNSNDKIELVTKIQAVEYFNLRIDDLFNTNADNLQLAPFVELQNEILTTKAPYFLLDGLNTFAVDKQFLATMLKIISNETTADMDLFSIADEGMLINE